MIEKLAKGSKQGNGSNPMLTEDVKLHVNNGFQKLAIAAAIAILKHKPPTLATIDFCHIIQANLREETDSNPNTICTFEENNSLQNRFCTTDLSQILNENNYSQPSCLQPSQVFQDIRDTINYDIDEDNSELLQNFDTLQAVSNVRRIICTMNGEHSFEGVTSNEFSSIENKLCPKGTQDSGYNSSQLLSGAYAVYKRKDTGFAQLNASLKILINYMINAANKDLNTSIVNYVSDIFGRSIDILYEHNIYLPSFDYVVDAIDSVMNQIFDKKQIEISSQRKCVFTIVLLNKATLLIQHSLMQLIKELQRLLDKLLRYGPLNEVLEISEPNEIDSSFFIFQLLEGLLRQRVENKSKNVKRRAESITSNNQLRQSHGSSTFKNNSMDYETTGVLKTTFIDHNEHLKKKSDEIVLKERCMNLLNRAILECVDTYPLISFWAMACLNIEK